MVRDSFLWQFKVEDAFEDFDAEEFEGYDGEAASAPSSDKPSADTKEELKFVKVSSLCFSLSSYTCIHFVQ